MISILLAVLMAFSPTPTQKLRDCEDTGKASCYTYDDGKWRVVTSYSPYKSKVVKLCSKGTKRACLMPEKKGTRIYVK